jgi:hypothetical protein
MTARNGFSILVVVCPIIIKMEVRDIIPPTQLQPPCLFPWVYILIAWNTIRIVDASRIQNYFHLMRTHPMKFPRDEEDERSWMDRDADVSTLSLVALHCKRTQHNLNEAICHGIFRWIILVFAHSYTSYARRDNSDKSEAFLHFITYASKFVHYGNPFSLRNHPQLRALICNLKLNSIRNRWYEETMWMHLRHQTVY